MDLSGMQFYQDIFGEEVIHFRCIKPQCNIVSLTGHYEMNLIEKLSEKNDQDYEIYFVPNSGGYKDSDISQINALFVDMDCGRDINNNYCSPDIVSEFKEQKLKELQQIVNVPSYIIETRNGFHAYWLLEKGTTIEQFKACLKRLIPYFKADKQVKNPAHLMRAPNFLWCKDKNNKFMVKIIAHYDVRYEINELINSLPPPVEESIGAHNKSFNNIKASIMGTQNLRSGNKSSDQTTSNLTYIINRDINLLHDKLNTIPHTVHNYEEVYEYLKRQNLNHFLGIVDKTFCCIFHNEMHPSANIYIDPLTGYYWYKCFSTSCGVILDIISVTRKLLRCNQSEALSFLRKIYRIEYEKSPWYIQQEENLESNLSQLRDEKYLSQQYPKTFARIKSYLPILEFLNNFALNNLIYDGFSFNGNPVFFAGLSFIANELNKSHVKRLGNSIGLLAYLGLINKLDETEIPIAMLKRAKHIAAKKKQSQLISFYSIPKYCEELLNYAEMKAQIFKEKHYTMKGWSREMILRGEGEDEANRVYPQMKGKKIPLLNQKITRLIEETALESIDVNGFVTESEIINQIHLEFHGHKQYKQKQLKKAIGEMLEKYQLQKVRLNKKLKEQLGITSNGYPFVITKIHEEE